MTMKVSVENINPVTKRLNIQVPSDVVLKEFESVYQDFSRRAKIKGFRPGKVPRDLLERYYGNAVKEEVLARLVEGSYREAISQQKVIPVSQPQIEGVKLEDGKGVSYSATVEVKPDVELKEYVGLRLIRRQYAVSDEDVKKAIDGLRERYAQVQPTSLVRPLQEGDFALIDYQLLAGMPAYQQITKGQVHRGKEEVLESKENVLVEVGSGTSPFDGGIHGMVAGEEREVVATDSSLATSGKRYKIKVKEVKVKVFPALDDEFSKTVGYNSVLELRKAVKERLEEDAKERTEREFRERIFDALIEKNPLEAPSSLVEDQVEFMVAEMKRLLGPKAGQVDEKKMREEFRPRAIERVKGALLLDAISNKEAIAVTDKEVDEEFKKIAQLRKERVEAVRERYRRQGFIESLTADIKREKALKLVADKGKVMEV